MASRQSEKEVLPNARSACISILDANDKRHENIMPTLLFSSTSAVCSDTFDATSSVAVAQRENRRLIRFLSYGKG